MSGTVFGVVEQLAWDMSTSRHKRRKKPGPKPNPARHDPRHRRRPFHRKCDPVHVVLRVVKDVPRLRGFAGYRALRGALLRNQKIWFRVVHASIQQNHFHFLVEAEDKLALTRGMQGLAISVAKRVNRACRRRGKVFAYRYHATPIGSPQQARSALSYVLNNWRRHQEDRAGFGALDPFATGYAFTGWTRAVGWYRRWAGIPSRTPETWLLAVGWQRGGPALSPYECPG